MHATMFVNLPVADVERSRRFFGALGYTFDEAYSSERALTVMLGEGRRAMLIETDEFAGLVGVEVADASKVKECVICLSSDSRDAVDGLVDRALAAGGTVGDTEDLGFMYGRSYHDLDGHAWQIFWVNPEGGDAPDRRSAGAAPATA